MARHQQGKAGTEHTAPRPDGGSKVHIRSSRREAEARKANLTFTVDDDFRWEMKAWCVRHHRSMVDALHEAFELLKREYGS